MPLLFFYGSLKEGFPNFHINTGERIPGDFRTSQPYPFFLADGTLPCLLLKPGIGHKVIGQLFDVSESALVALDELERVGEPGGYVRTSIEVEAADGASDERILALVYAQHESRLSPNGKHVGPIAEYTHEHAKTLSW